MANVKILVMGDNETWETFYKEDGARVCEIAQEDYQRLCEGEVEVFDLYNEKKIIRESGIKESN